MVRLTKNDRKTNGLKKAGFNCRFCKIDFVLKELWDIQSRYPKTFKNESYRHKRLQGQIRMTAPIDYCRIEILRNLEWMAQVALENNDGEQAMRYCDMGLDEIAPDNRELIVLHGQAMKQALLAKKWKKGHING